MVVTLVSLVIMTAAAIGLPAIRTMRVQFDRQALEILAQSSHTISALLKSEQSELESLALLTIQRPTFQILTQQENVESLEAYLLNLQRGVGLDVILICDPQSGLVVHAGSQTDAALCQEIEPGRHVVWKDPAASTGWLLYSQPFSTPAAENLVVVGRALDEKFALRLKESTGMEIILLLDGRFLSSSISSQTSAQAAAAQFLAQQVDIQRGAEEASHLYSLEGASFYASRTAGPDPSLSSILFLPAQTIHQAQREMTLLASGLILVVIIVGSVLGVFRARQISNPLRRLRDAAKGLRRGDLVSPVNVRTNIQEIAQVASALDEARSTLQYSVRQLRDEKAWMDHLMESIVEGILTIDRRGRITYFSRGAEQITGWKSSEVLGTRLDEVFPITSQNVSISTLIPDPGGRLKVSVQLRDGRQAMLAITGAQLAPPEAGKSSTVLVLRDVSDEEAIRRLLGEFLANISHEFRTPLTALAASIELMLDQLPDLNRGELEELLDATHLGVINLETLIDNLLEGANLETGQFRIFPRLFDLGEILRETAATMTPLARKYGQEIRLNLPPAMPDLEIDARRIGQVLTNLLSNAIKWGPPQGVILLSAEVQEAELCVSVEDDGPGIPDGAQENIFSRFDRIQTPAARAESGAGLGLSVVKAIVEAHCGRVGAQNRAAGGAHFWFSLPLSRKE